MWPRINLYHCMRGYAENIIGVPSAGVGLYNNSPQNHYLVVRDVRSGSLRVAVLLIRSAHLATIPTASGTVVPIVTGERAGPGFLYTFNDTSTVVPSDYPISPSTAALPGWVHEFPVAVLQPGWSLEVVLFDAPYSWIGFYWEYVTPDQMRLWWEIEAQGG